MQKHFTGGGLLINVYFGGCEFKEIKNPSFLGDYRLRVYPVAKRKFCVTKKNTQIPGTFFTEITGHRKSVFCIIYILYIHRMYKHKLYNKLYKLYKS